MVDENRKTVPTFTWIGLLILGCLDLIRGLIYTIFINITVTTIANINLTTPLAGDLKLQIIAVGISNLISGVTLVIIALKARKWAEMALLYIPFAYLVGYIALKIYDIVPTSDFLGNYIMMVYIGVSLLTFIATRVKRWRDSKDNRDIGENGDNVQHDTTNKKTVPKFAWIALMILGFLDLIRGILHTLLINKAIATFAHYDLSDPVAGDIMYQMNAFGVSNLITGFILILIALKIRDMVDITLISIPIAYVIGTIAIRTNGSEVQSDLLGKYMMIVYIGICMITFFAYKVKNWRDKKES
ncbi:MAG: hypothetical protein ACTSRK_00815 [Promethearchaeota archaeon]